MRRDWPKGLSEPRAILFDWDNTLVDNWSTIAMALNATFAAFAMPPWSLDEVKQRVRASMRDSFPLMFGDRWEEAREVFYDAFRTRHLEALAALPGADALLAGLAARGLYLGVVSNKTGSFLRREAAHLGWEAYFGGIVGAGDTPRDKPAVDPVALALKPGGIAPGPAVWFVGDTAIDMECAYNAGCTAVLLHAAPTDDHARHPPALHLLECKALLALLAEP